MKIIVNAIDLHRDDNILKAYEVEAIDRTDALHQARELLEADGIDAMLEVAAER
jgi:hypothetical protein